MAKFRIKSKAEVCAYLELKLQLEQFERIMASGKWLHSKELNKLGGDMEEKVALLRRLRESGDNAQSTLK